MLADDDAFVAAVADVAAQAHAGHHTPASVVSILRAIASTRSEQQRHELARRAEERARAVWNELSAVALQVLRVGVFGLAV